MRSVASAVHACSLATYWFSQTYDIPLSTSRFRTDEAQLFYLRLRTWYRYKSIRIQLSVFSSCSQYCVMYIQRWVYIGIGLVRFRPCCLLFSCLQGVTVSIKLYLGWFRHGPYLTAIIDNWLYMYQYSYVCIFSLYKEGDLLSAKHGIYALTQYIWHLPTAPNGMSYMPLGWQWNPPAHGHWLCIPLVSARCELT
jgi:hypothetical protein